MKKNAEKVQEMMDLLSKAYADPAINKRPDLKQMILKCATDLQKSGDVDLLSSRLCKEITLKYLANKTDFPKSVMNLYYLSKGKEAKYDGIALASMLGSTVWF